MAQNLAAQRDGVVEEAAVRVVVDGLLVVIDRVCDIALPEHEVTDAIEQRDIELGGVLLVRIEQLDIDQERLVKLLFQLVFGSLLLQLCDVGHSVIGRVNLPLSYSGNKVCRAPTWHGSGCRRTSMAARGRLEYRTAPSPPKSPGRFDPSLRRAPTPQRR